MRTADERIQSALKRIEHAQWELIEACSDLSAVIGMVRPWSEAGKLADRVKAFWHKLNGRFQGKRGEWKLDSLSGGES